VNNSGVLFIYLSKYYSLMNITKIKIWQQQDNQFLEDLRLKKKMTKTENIFIV